MNIKRVLILSGVLALSFSMFGCGGGKWQEVKTVTIEHKSNIGGFESPNFGITVGYSGEVHYSNDGGETWTENKLPEIDLEKGPIYISHDGKLASINNHNGSKITLLEEK